MSLLTRPPRLLSYFHFALIAALALALLYLIQVGVFVIAEQQHPWITGDWLINYESGFVRRGLSGELMFGLADLTRSRPAFVVATIQLVLYGVFLVALLANLARKEIGLPLLLACFSPLTLVFPVLDVAALGRKEVIAFAFFACFVFALRSPWRHERRAAVIAGALAVGATLMHELFAFFTPYFVLAELLLRPPSRRRVPVVSLAVVAGACLVVVIVAVWGATIDGDAVCGKLVANGLSPDSCNGAMLWSPRSLTDEIAHTFEIAASDRYATVYSRGALLALLPFLVAWLTIEPIKRVLRTFVGGLAVCFAWSMPLFLTAVDWGRFLAIHFTLQLVLIAALAPRADERAAESSLRNRVWTNAIYIVTLYLTLLLQSFWSVPHCCRPSLGDGIIGLFLEP